jgi:putative cell wall-binding protein
MVASMGALPVNAAASAVDNVVASANTVEVNAQPTALKLQSDWWHVFDVTQSTTSLLVALPTELSQLHLTTLNWFVSGSGGQITGSIAANVHDFEIPIPLTIGEPTEIEIDSPSDSQAGDTVRLYAAFNQIDGAGPAAAPIGLDTSTATTGGISSAYSGTPTPATIAPTGTIVVHGPAGFWKAGPAGDWTVGGVVWAGLDNNRKMNNFALSYSVSSDASSISLTIPADVSAGYHEGSGDAWSGIGPTTTIEIDVSEHPEDPNSGGGAMSFDIPVRLDAPSVLRVSGLDRFGTSVALAQAGYPGTAPVVFVATGVNYPDALAAGPAAAKLGGPLLLTMPDALPGNVSDEIKSLHPGKIVLVGGTSAVSAVVESQLKELAATVDRVAGTDRFDTARKVVDYAFGSASNVYVATGMNYPDALSAAAAAGANSLPVVLVNGGGSAVDVATMSLLTKLGATRATVVGGTSAVSAGVESSLVSALGAGNVFRLSGSDRFETSVLIAKDAFISNVSAYFATGLQFPDALAGSALAAAKHAPLFTVLPGCVPAETMQEVTALGVSEITLIGGTSALSADVARLTQCT